MLHVATISQCQLIKLGLCIYGLKMNWSKFCIINICKVLYKIIIVRLYSIHNYKMNWSKFCIGTCNFCIVLRIVFAQALKLSFSNFNLKQISIVHCSWLLQVFYEHVHVKSRRIEHFLIKSNSAKIIIIEVSLIQWARKILSIQNF